MSYYEWAPYVPVAERRKQAAAAMAKRAKKGLAVEPVVVEGRTIARSAWGKRWCAAMEAQADYANRLPRGRTYARNGSVVHLHVARGEVTAVVSGSELYDVKVTVAPLGDAKWKAVRRECAGKVGSALALLQGKLSDAVMDLIARPGSGLVPLSGEVKFRCSCPDSASLCKHCAAVLYGVGARLDTKPELLFTLRGVSHLDLVEEATASATKKGAVSGALQADDATLADIFGIELGGAPSPTTAAPTAKKKAPAPAKKKAPAKPAVATPEYTMAQVRAMGHLPKQVKAMIKDGTLVSTSFGWYRFTR